MAAVGLPPVLDLSAAGPLAATLLARRGSPLVLEGSAVERLGAQCLQVILAAKQTWDADGQSFGLSAPSPALSDALATLGAAHLAETHGVEA